MTPPPTPIYLDWIFWTAVVAMLALVLSQLPPLRVLLRRTRLNIQLFDRLNVTDSLGNPNVNLFIQLINMGGRSIRVLRMHLEFEADDRTKFVLPAQRLSRPDKADTYLLFTPFNLRPDDEWSHFVNFFEPFSMNDERIVKQATKDLRSDIEDKIERRRKLAGDQNGLMEAESKFVDKFQEFYKSHYKWRPGEYTAHLRIECTPKRATQIYTFRFTLFESDIQELDERTTRYKYGAGVYFPDHQATEVYPRIRNLE